LSDVPRSESEFKDEVLFESGKLERDARVFAALASVVRLRILRRVIAHPDQYDLQHLSFDLGLDYHAFYRHVEVLLAVGLLETRVVGRSRLLSACRPDLVRSLLWLLGSEVKQP
jgi:DNA-binding transcriptional ArsR family regulator